MSISDLFFGFDGRLDRADYWRGVGATLLFLAPLGIVAFGGGVLPERDDQFSSLSYLTTALQAFTIGMGAWVAAALWSKRLRDQGRPAWMMLTALLPAAMLFQGLVWPGLGALAMVAALIGASKSVAVSPA